MDRLYYRNTLVLSISYHLMNNFQSHFWNLPYEYIHYRLHLCLQSRTIHKQFLKTAARRNRHFDKLEMIFYNNFEWISNYI